MPTDWAVRRDEVYEVREGAKRESVRLGEGRSVENKEVVVDRSNANINRGLTGVVYVELGANALIEEVLNLVRLASFL